MAEQQQTADSGTPPINPVADVFEGLKADLTQFLKEPTPQDGSSDGDGANPAADADGDQPNDLSQDSKASEAPDEGGGEPVPAGEGDEPDLSKVSLTPEQRQAIGAKVSERIREAKAKYAAEAEAAKAALELELNQVRAKLEEAEAKAAAAPAAAAPPPDFVAQATQAKGAVDLAAELLDTLQDDPDYVAEELKRVGLLKPEAEVTRPELRRLLRTVKGNAEKAVEQAKAQAERFQSEFAASSARALVLMPELRDPKSERNKLLQQVLAQAPWLRQIPNWPEAAARQVLGMERERELAAKPAAGKPAAKPPATPKARATLGAVEARGTNALTDDERAAAMLGENPAARSKLMAHLLRGS